MALREEAGTPAAASASSRSTSGNAAFESPQVSKAAGKKSFFVAFLFFVSSSSSVSFAGEEVFRDGRKRYSILSGDCVSFYLAPVATREAARGTPRAHGRPARPLGCVRAGKQAAVDDVA